MKNAEVVVGWEGGLHARPASKLVKIARQFTAEIRLKCDSKVANARSILNILLLCASLGTTIQIEAVGEDEGAAISAITAVFEADE